MAKAVKKPVSKKEKKKMPSPQAKQAVVKIPQVDDTNNKLKDLLKKLLIHNGLENSIPLAEKKDELRKVEYVLISIWVISSVLLLPNSQSRFLWFLLIIPALIMEQVIYLIYRYFQYKMKNGTTRGFIIKDTLNRPIHLRFNTLFFVSFFIISIMVYILFVPWLAFLYVMNSFFWGYILINDKVKNTKAGVDLFLSLALEFLRLIKQLWSILNSGIGLVAPGIIVAFVAAAISQDLWQYVTQISWWQLDLMSVLILCLVIVPSISRIKKSLDEEIQQMGLEKNPFSADMLRDAVIRRSSYADSDNISQELFSEYQDYFSWKLLGPIYDMSKRELVDELKRRAIWRFVWSILFITPIIFLFLFAATVFLFPADLLKSAQWTGREIISPWMFSTIGDVILHGTHSSFITWAVSAENPILKFSVISMLLLVANFVISYSSDGKKILSNLLLSKDVLNEWLTIICGFHVVREPEFQGIVKDWPWKGYDLARGGDYVLIILIPDSATKELVERIVPRVKELYGANNLLSFAMFIRVSEYLKTSTAIRLNLGSMNNLANTTLGNLSANSVCWVWTNRHVSNLEIFEFATPAEADAWIKT